MKYLLVILAFFASSVFAFQPNDLMEADIQSVKPCNQFVCALVEKDGKQYIIMGQPADEETVMILAIYIVEGKKLRMVWSILWQDT